MDPGTVIWTYNNGPEPTGARTWRARKGLMEVVTGRTWLDPGLSHKARNTREHVLLRCWQDCVADRFGRREGVPPNTLAPPKSVFSYEMTVMDKVEGWNEEEWAGSRFAACMWIHTKAVLCDLVAKATRTTSLPLHYAGHVKVITQCCQHFILLQDDIEFRYPPVVPRGVFADPTNTSHDGLELPPPLFFGESLTILSRIYSIDRDNGVERNWECDWNPQCRVNREAPLGKNTQRFQLGEKTTRVCMIEAHEATRKRSKETLKKQRS